MTALRVVYFYFFFFQVVRNILQWMNFIMRFQTRTSSTNYLAILNIWSYNSNFGNFTFSKGKISSFFKRTIPSIAVCLMSSRCDFLSILFLKLFFCRTFCKFGNLQNSFTLSSIFFSSTNPSLTALKFSPKFLQDLASLNQDRHLHFLQFLGQPPVANYITIKFPFFF